VAKQTLSAIEGGQANPTVLTLTTIAAALGIPLAHLLIEYGSPVLVRRASDAVWEESPDGIVRDLDQVYGSGLCAPRSSGTTGRAVPRLCTAVTGSARCTMPWS
jgi:transcriptional regulator with XRE-family HTH domain